MFNTRMHDCFLMVHVDWVATGQEMVRGKIMLQGQGIIF